MKIRAPRKKTECPKKSLCTIAQPLCCRFKGYNLSSQIYVASHCRAYAFASVTYFNVRFLAQCARSSTCSYLCELSRFNVASHCRAYAFASVTYFNVRFLAQCARSSTCSYLCELSRFNVASLCCAYAFASRLLKTLVYFGHPRRYLIVFAFSSVRKL